MQVWFVQIISPEKESQRRRKKRKKWLVLRWMCLGSGDVSSFLLGCYVLRTCKPLFLYFWCTCLMCFFPTTFPLPPSFLMIDEELCKILLPVYQNLLSILSFQASYMSWPNLTINVWWAVLRCSVTYQHGKVWIPRIVPGDGAGSWGVSEEGDHIPFRFHPHAPSSLCRTEVRKETFKEDGIHCLE